MKQDIVQTIENLEYFKVYQDVFDSIAISYSGAYRISIEEHNDKLLQTIEDQKIISSNFTT